MTTKKKSYTEKDEAQWLQLETRDTYWGIERYEEAQLAELNERRKAHWREYREIKRLARIIIRNANGLCPVCVCPETQRDYESLRRIIKNLQP